MIKHDLHIFADRSLNLGKRVGKEAGREDHAYPETFDFQYIYDFS